MSTNAGPTPRDAPCPCGSGSRYEACCGPYHAGQALPPTARILMRSRYSAYALGLPGYLRETWARATRPASLAFDSDRITWVALEILEVRGGEPEAREGVVEFVAHGIAGEHLSILRETSRFVREDGAWRYLDGVLTPTTPARIGRNAPCPCGGGRKFKRCHAR